jgi:uncharacterized membrane protein YbhN (UPF0104 family)
VLLQAMGVRRSFRFLLNSFMVGLFYNLFTPSNMGQDVARVVDIRRSGGNQSGILNLYSVVQLVFLLNSSENG